MKASEVFDLPLDADDSCLYQSCGSDKYVARFDSQEQAKVAVNCINHADALADALEALLPNIDTHRELAASAAKALAAYRGAK